MSALAVKFFTGLRTKLVDHAGLSALVGERVYFVQAPQHVTAPHLVVTQISGGEDSAHDGPIGLEDYRLQFDLYAETGLVCLQIRDALKTCLAGYSGTLGTAPDEVLCGACFPDTEDASWSDRLGLKHARVDFLFQIEPIPN